MFDGLKEKLEGRFSANSENETLGYKGYVSIALAIFVIICLWSSFYMVNKEENAVVKTCGAYTKTTQSGAHFKLPFFQSITKVNVQKVRRIEVGFRTETLGSQLNYKPVLGEALMLTGDQNIADVHFVVQYQITDPSKWLFTAEKPDEIVNNLFQAAIREVMGKSALNTILTSGKVNIQNMIFVLLTEGVKNTELGVSIISTQLQDALPPEKVLPAYNGVNAAEQKREELKNQAYAYANKVTPAAEGTYNQMISEASGEREYRINTAKGDVAVFDVLRQKYEENPRLLEQRLRFETLQEVLKGKSQIIDMSRQGIAKLMDINGATIIQPNQHK